MERIQGIYRYKEIKGKYKGVEVEKFEGFEELEGIAGII